MFPEGRPPKVGERISRPYLAESLQSVTAGRDAFYLDRVGSAIPEATGDLITRDDLSRCQARWVIPLRAELFGRTAWTTPPNSQGYLTLSTLAIFEQLGTTGDPEHPDYWHALIEAYRSMAWERDHLLYDPDTGPGLDMLDSGEAGRAQEPDRPCGGRLVAAARYRPPAGLPTCAPSTVTGWGCP